MTFMVMIPADLDRLITFFKHLFEMVKKTYPDVITTELNTDEDKEDE